MAMSRKRHAPGGSSRDNNNNVRKKFRSSSSKKLKLSHRHMKVVPQVDQEEIDTIEKRNLHNNMERQRRIGLKNLFEELKCHIPSLKEKERAPKVNILREAAAYCTKLRREEEQYAELLKKHNRLLSRVRNLKSSIAQRRHY
jgi:Myc proto-oncogene protein